MTEQSLKADPIDAQAAAKGDARAGQNAAAAEAASASRAAPPGSRPATGKRKLLAGVVGVVVLAVIGVFGIPMSMALLLPSGHGQNQHQRIGDVGPVSGAGGAKPNGR